MTDRILAAIFGTVFVISLVFTLQLGRIAHSLEAIEQSLQVLDVVEHERKGWNTTNFPPYGYPDVRWLIITNTVFVTNTPAEATR